MSQQLPALAHSRILRVVGTAMLMCFPQASLAADEWSTPSQRAAWSEALEAESVGEASSGILFNEAGSVAGLHGDFPVSSFKVSAIRGWIHAHREMLGLLPSEFVDYDKTTAFYEALPEGSDGVYGEQTGIVLSFSVVIGDVKAGPGSFKVFADKRTGRIRGLLSSHEPTTQGYLPPVVGFTEGKAWDAVESYLGAPLRDRSAATQLWTSVPWLTERTPKQKELLWVLRGETDQGDVEVFIVSPTGVLHREGGKAWLGEVPQVHRGYGTFGNIYWQSSGVGGCNGPGPTCTNPAFQDSLASRVEVPLFAEIWSNLSLTNWSSSYLDWPWTGPDEAPLKSVRAKNAIGTTRELGVVVAHNGSECGTASGGFTPCSSYTTLWMGPGDVGASIYGHEMGHNVIKDLKSTSHNQFVTGNAGRAAALTEAIADYIGIVQEDFRLKADDPNPAAPRTDFKLEAPSTNLVIDWKSSSCQPAVPVRSARGALGRGWFEAWQKMGAYPTAHARRDVLFRAWQASILIAYSYTTNSFPTPRDMAAAHVAMIPSPLFSYPNRPYPNALLANEVLRELAPGCW